MRRMDEMELRIRDSAVKWSWFFTVIALFIWGMYDSVKNQAASIPLMLLSLQFLVYFLVSSISKWKVGDEDGKKQITWYLGGTVFFIIVFGMILYFAVGRSL